MRKAALIRRIALQNVLSFGPQPIPLDLGPLTVLIGPNGSGKSNLLEAFSLLHQLPNATPNSAVPVIDWIWKGARRGTTASVEVILDGVEVSGERLRYRLDFRELGQRFSVVDERIENETKRARQHKPIFYFGYEEGLPRFKSLRNGRWIGRSLRRDQLDAERSVLAQRNDPSVYPEIAHVRAVFEGIGLYRSVTFGGDSPTRQPQRTDLPNEVLLEDGSNLALILSRLKTDVSTQRGLPKYLREFYEPAVGVDVQIQGGTAQIYVTEQNWTTPATRLSDGTMRWLCLLATLLDPTPPGLVCLDEPDLGLHPDIIPTLADLLVEASKRMQVVVTTHSDILVAALGSEPERVVVCEKHDGSTTMRRLDSEMLKKWLEKYSLGELWISGELGGKRW